MSHHLGILFEDNHLLIVNKNAGMLVQGDRTGDKPLAEHCKTYIKKRYQKPGAVFLGVVHRLDRPVSGVVVFARTSKALERMNKLFREKAVKKTYWAATLNKPKAENGRLVNWLRKDPKNNTTKAFRSEQKNALKSELEYKVIGQVGKYSLIEVNPLTGRPHQIRVQLSHMGCPINGDLKYGAPKPNPDASINLHARSLEFIHPVKKEMIKIFAPLPTNIVWDLFTGLEEYPE